MKPEKKDAALALIERGGMFVHLNPRMTGIVIPDYLYEKSHAILQFGPIPDLEIDSLGISGTLSFNRVPFKVVVPWTAIFALVGDDAKGFVWEDEIPAEVKEIMKAPASKAPSKTTNKTNLKVIDGGKAPKKDRSHLRLVK